MRRLASFVACVVTAVGAPQVAPAKPLLVVSAETGGEIVLVDAAKAQVVAQIKVGPRPRGLKLSRDGRRLFVALAGPPKPATPTPTPGPAPAPVPAGELAPGLAIVDLGAKKVTKRIATPPSPFGVDLLPDGRTAFVSNSETSEVFRIDVAKGLLEKKAPVGLGPQAVAVRPDGKGVYVVTHGSDEISVVDPKTMQLLQRIDAGSKPQTVLFGPKGDLAFVVDEGLPTVTILDAKKNSFKEQFVLQGLANRKPPAILQSAVLSPDGTTLYVTTGQGRSVLIVDLAKKTAVGAIENVGGFLRGIAISRDGRKLYTANGPSNDVAIVDVASKKVEARVAVPGAPWGLVLVP